jgi:NADPH:quinone reductase-like Zn-dependent oxidoreductase
MTNKEKMKVAWHSEYGPPEELQIKEVDKPIPQDNEVLIKIHAATVTSSDCNIRNLTFAPTWSRVPMRLFVLGAIKPKTNILGIDLAGVIEAVGKDVKEFNVGDQVFGRPDPAMGAHAEYVCIAEDGVLTKKTANTKWEEAACLPQAGNTALYFIRDMMDLQAGQKILINGASGAIGSYAVQLAKYYGAEVTGVCSSTNVELVKSLGADKVIDYTKEDFTKNNETYDVIFDVVGKAAFSNCKNSLKEKGMFVSGLPSMAIISQTMWTSMVGRKKVKFGDALGKAENLDFLKELYEAGKLRSVIDKSYPLEDIAEAFRHAETGHKIGNIVITVAD